MKYMDLSPEDRAARGRYVNELVGEVAPRVWVGLSGNGSLRIAIDTDVQCYGPWEPHECDDLAYAQSWVEYFVRSAVNQLVDRDLLNAPGQED